jgi:hypothetical protein
MSMKTRPVWITILLFCAAFLLLSACNYPGVQAQDDQFATAAAETVAAQLTEAALAPPTGSEATATLPAETDDAATPTASSTSSPTPSATPSCTDKAKFIEDITVPDDSFYAHEEEFEKIWKLQNVGTCTWTTEYSLVFDSGNIMGGPVSINLSGAVAPQAFIEIGVDLTAPATNGTHRGNWKLRNTSGKLFGLGTEAQTAFWVQIKTGPTPTPVPKTIYNFTSNYCSAAWTSSIGALPCPGGDGDPEGFILRLSNPKLENGVTENEAALVTHPRFEVDGWIRGEYPAIDIIDGDYFRTVIGCIYDGGGSSCDVDFQLIYSANGGAFQLLKEWNETYNGSLRSINLDLGDQGLAGKSVKFVLIVRANGSSTDDSAFWLMPRISGPTR